MPIESCPPTPSEAQVSNEVFVMAKKSSNESGMMVEFRPWSTGVLMRTHPVARKRPLSQHYSTPTNYRYAPKNIINNIPEPLALQMSIILGKTKASQDDRDTHVKNFCLFLISSVSQQAKLSRLRMFVSLATPEEASWQLLDPILKDTLRFLTDRIFDWHHQHHSAHVVLLELRAMCLYEMERQSIVIKGSQVMAGCIFGAARMVEDSLEASIPIIHVALDLAASQAKLRMTPAAATRPRLKRSKSAPLLLTRDEVVTKTYTDMAKRTTNSVKETAQWTAKTIKQASTDRIQSIAQRFEENSLGERLIPNEAHRNVIVAAGTVGIASLGAAAIVGEAVVKTTASVACKATAVTTDVVRYKYGDHAGQIVEDASLTTGNILETVGHVTMFEASVLAKSVAKNTVVVQAKRTHEGEDDVSDDDGDKVYDSLDALRAGTFESHLAKVDPHAAVWAKKNGARPRSATNAVPTRKATLKEKSSGNESFGD